MKYFPLQLFYNKTCSTIQLTAGSNYSNNKWATRINISPCQCSLTFTTLAYKRLFCTFITHFPEYLFTSLAKLFSTLTHLGAGKSNIVKSLAVRFAPAPVPPGLVSFTLAGKWKLMFIRPAPPPAEYIRKVSFLNFSRAS